MGPQLTFYDECTEIILHLFCYSIYSAIGQGSHLSRMTTNN